MQTTDAPPKDKGTTSTPTSVELTGDDEVLDGALTELAAEGLLDDERPAPADGGTDGGTGEGAEALTPPDGEDPDLAAAALAADAPAVVPAEGPAVVRADGGTAGTAVDPLADTAPLDYTLDGQVKVFDGILVDKTNGGAFILPNRLDAVRNRLIEGDRLQTQVAHWQDRATQYDGLRYRSGPKGQEREYKGFQAFQQLTADAAANSAAGMFLLKTLSDAFPGEANAAALLHVFKQAEFEHKRVQFEAGQQFARTYQQQRAQSVATASAPAQEQAWMGKYLTDIRKALPALTEADVAAGEAFFAKRPQMVYRTATARDAAQFGVKVGERIGDTDALNAWYSERAALRAEDVKKTQAQVAATSTAGKHNAGMEKGRQTGKAPVPARSGKPATPATGSTEKVSKKQVYTDILTDALQEMGVSD